jgi:hypothetical protein
MKKQMMIPLACAIPLFIYATWNPDLLAAGRNYPSVPNTGSSAVDYPIGTHCVVTVDPLAGSKPIVARTANKVTGFVAPDTAEGNLIRIDEEWVVLRDGSSDAWIPRNKIIMMYFSR